VPAAILATSTFDLAPLLTTALCDSETFAMSHTPDRLLYFAQRLNFESKGKSLPHEKMPTSIPAIDKRRPHHASLTGNAGFQALLSRALALALALAAREIPWMASLQVKVDGTLEGFGQMEKKISHEEIASGCEVLLALLLGLLVDFIGEFLTLGLVREVWPRLPLDDYFRACPRLREALWHNALAAEKSGHGSPKRLPCPKFEAYDLVTTLNPSSNCDYLHLSTRPSSSTSLCLWPA
jgi:hypothetical protein